MVEVPEKVSMLAMVRFAVVAHLVVEDCVRGYEQFAAAESNRAGSQRACIADGEYPGRAIVPGLKRPRHNVNSERERLLRKAVPDNNAILPKRAEIQCCTGKEGNRRCVFVQCRSVRRGDRRSSKNSQRIAEDFIRRWRRWEWSLSGCAAFN
jgi:hypothetical protein